MRTSTVVHCIHGSIHHGKKNDFVRPDVKELVRLRDSGTLSAEKVASIDTHLELGKKIFTDACNWVDEARDILATADPESKDAKDLRAGMVMALKHISLALFHDVPYDLALNMIETFDEPALSALKALLHKIATVTDTKGD